MTVLAFLNWLAARTSHAEVNALLEERESQCSSGALSGPELALYIPDIELRIVEFV